MKHKKGEEKSSDREKRLTFCVRLRGMNIQSRSMRGKLMLYLCCLVLAGNGILLLMLTATGVFAESGRGLEQSLKVQLQNQKRDIKERMDFFAGNGIDLSKRLTLSIERDTLTYPYDIGELENDEEGLEKMQANIYPLLESELNITRASGVFAVFDTTVNTEAPGARRSRSGLYLRVANVSSSSAFENDIFLFRGNPDIAMQNRIQLHNRWNMEFDIEQMEWYRNQLYNEALKNVTEGYLWIERHALEGTWENGIFLSVPVVGSGDVRYGLCGLEISSLWFRLNYPAVESRYGDMVTILAPVDGDRLLIPNGLIGEQGNIYISDGEELRIFAGKRFNTYQSGNSKYLGIHRTLHGAEDGYGRQWAVVVLIQYSSFHAQARNERVLLIIILSVFILIMLFSSYIISQRFVRPIEQGIENLKTDKMGERQITSGITEIDVLAQFLKLKEEKYMGGGRTESRLPPNIEELFNRFIERAKTLTISERNILGYYINGHETAEVPALACISMNTVRKHNRSIYEKLGVNSKDELQLYLDLLRRCGRLDEL